jgi:hypothetical protein
MVIISQITARLTKLFGRKSGVKCPTLHEAAKCEGLASGRNAKEIGENKSSQIEISKYLNVVV